MNTVTQSVLSTNFVQVPVTVITPAGYDPTGDTVQFAFIPASYPQPLPGSSDWNAGSWVTFPGPVYWAQILVGPLNGGVNLAAGNYLAWLKITDSPAVPVLQPFTLTILD